MGRKSSSKPVVVNIAHYNALTGKLSIYREVQARFRYDNMIITDPETGKTKTFNIRNVKDGEIDIREQSAILWSTGPIDFGTAPIDIEDFKQAVWDYRLEHYGDMVSDALSLIRQQQASLELARKALLD